jgi:hypothetical protein
MTIRSCAFVGASASTTIRCLGPVAPASGAGGRGLEGDGVAARARERGGGFDQVRVAVAGQRLAGRLKRGGLAAVEGVDLAAVEDRHGAEENAPLLVVGLGRGGLVAATRGHRREDPDGVFAFADAVAEFEPGLEAGDKARVGVGEQDQAEVRHGVAPESVASAGADPALPALGAEQLLAGVSEALTVTGASLIALGLGETALVRGHRDALPCGAPPGAAPVPPPPQPSGLR